MLKVETSSRGMGKEQFMVEMFKTMLAQGKNGIMVAATAAARARLIWFHKLPKESVICSGKG